MQEAAGSKSLVYLFVFLVCFWFVRGIDLASWLSVFLVHLSWSDLEDLLLTLHEGGSRFPVSCKAYGMFLSFFVGLGCLCYEVLSGFSSYQLRVSHRPFSPVADDTGESSKDGHWSLLNTKYYIIYS